MPEMLGDKAAIVGAANTSFGVGVGRSSRSMAMEAIHLAILDAGLNPKDIDGVQSFTFDPVPEFDVVRSFGLRNLRYFGQVPYGNAAGAVAMAALAVATGQATNVAVFRSIKAIPGHTSDYQGSMEAAYRTQAGPRGFYFPFGLLTLAHWTAITAQRYLYRYNVDGDAFGWITVAVREHASRNPSAILSGKSLTIEAHRQAPFLATPVKMVDCGLSSDGASAVVVTSAERALDMACSPVYVKAVAHGTGGSTELATNYNRPELDLAEECKHVAHDLFAAAGIGPQDLDFLQICDDVSPLVLMALEAMGVCGQGEGSLFVEGAQRITVGGELPINTAGGHLGEADVQSMNHVVEAVKQLRGQAAVQIAGAKMGLVLSGNGGPSSGLILRS